MMTQNLIISGLQYEELVLLQELMVLVDQTDVIDHPLLIEDRETFESLYNKVMNAWQQRNVFRKVQFTGVVIN